MSIVRRSAAILFVAAFAATPIAVAGAVADRSNPWSDWHSLRLVARAGPFFSGTLELERVSSKAGERLESRSVARFLGMTISRSRSESKSAEGRLVEHLAISKRRGRHYRFDASGYVVETFRAERGPDSAPATWERTGERRFEGSAEASTSCPAPLVDYYSMLLQLGRLPLREPGQEARVCVATGHGPVAFLVTVGDSRNGKRKIKSRSGGPSRELLVREIRLRVRPADPAQADEGFLNMEGETEIWVEAATKTPLEISGEVPRVPGRVRLELSEID